MQYSVSVIVPTYNPDYCKLMITLKSIILQQNVDIQIVLSDDASTSFNSGEIRRFFKKNHFENYIILENKFNSGTVKNLQKALEFCKYDLIRDIGQSDVLYNELSLYHLCEYQNINNADVVLSNAQNFNYTQDGITFLKTIRMPQNIEAFRSNRKLVRYYVMYGDIGNGATTFYKKSVYLKYLSEADGVIKLAEDQLLKIMIFDNLNVCYFNKTTLLYEFGHGVSKPGSRLLDPDTNSILTLFKKRANSRKGRRVYFSLVNRNKYILNQTIQRRLIWYLTTPGLILYIARYKFHPVYLSDEENNAFLMKCISN